MPRKVRAADLETRTARSRLKKRHKPFFRLIEPGLHLGYRTATSGPGKWLVRRYDKDTQNYVTENLRTAVGQLVIADDYSEADGEYVLSFAQAQEKAKPSRRAAGSYTVTEAMDDYLQSLENDHRSKHSIRDTRCRINAFVRKKLGDLKIDGELTTERLRAWRDELVKTAPRLRTQKGKQQKYRELADTEEARRKRCNSANRCRTILIAALNYAFHEGKVQSDLEWRKLKPFKKVDAARLRYLTVTEAKRLINACDPEFRPLVQAALQTGCRYGELIRLQVHDFNPDSGTLTIQQSKSGKARHVVLTAEGVNLFRQLTVGRSGDEVLLRKANGQPFGMSHQLRPMAEAVKRAKIKPAISFHGLRHTWASLAVMNGMPLMVVARNLGHADTRMVEKHYGHLTPSYVAGAVRKSAPRFGTVKASNVAAIR